MTLVPDARYRLTAPHPTAEPYGPNITFPRGTVFTYRGRYSDTRETVILGGKVWRWAIGLADHVEQEPVTCRHCGVLILWTEPFGRWSDHDAPGLDFCTDQDETHDGIRHEPERT